MKRFIEPKKTKFSCKSAILFLSFLLSISLSAQQADLDQARNGPYTSPNNPVNWVNGNVNQSQAHMVEDYSIPYRLVMTGMPVNSTVELDLEYDTRHGGANALDFMTAFNNLVPHDVWGHPTEAIQPLDGYPALSALSEVHIPVTQPGALNGQGPTGLFQTNPTTLADFWLNFNWRKPGKNYMSIWGATLTGISTPFQYLSEQNLVGNITSTRIRVTFKVTNATIILAWGGHIAREQDWGPGNSAAGIQGSPYHTRTIAWNLDNLGNQDRSMQAAVVLPDFDCAFNVASPVCANTQVTATKTLPVTASATYSWLINSITGASPTPLTGTGTSFTFNSGAATGTFNLDLTATVPFANTSISRTCTQPVSVTTLSGCSITANSTAPYCPSSDMTFSGPAGMSTYAWTITGNGSISGASNAQSVTVHAGTTCGSSFILSLTIANAANCSSTCQQSFMVNDATSPVFAGCPAGPIALGCNPSTLPGCTTALSLVTVTDGCSGQMTPTCQAGTITSNGCQRTQIFTLSATDACQHTATCAVTYTWTVDLTAPVISTTSSSRSLGCNPETIVEPTFTGNDGCSGNFTPVVNTTGPSNTGCNYTQTWTANYTDPCNNPAVPVNITYTWTIDNTLPVISTEAASHDLGCNPGTIVPPAFTGSDGCAGTFSPVVNTPGPSNNGCHYTQTWNAAYTDPCGNVAVPKSVTYTWTIDNTLPVISTEATSHYLGCNPGPIVAPVFNGNDGCAGNFSPIVNTQGPSNTGCNYSQTWTATYTDPCNNVAIPVSITYIWTIDITAPIITTNATSHFLGCNPGIIVVPVFNGNDGCSGVFTPVVSTEGPSNTGCSYTQTWTASYTDPCNNPATPVSITYTWTIDNSAPVISTTATSHDLGCNPGPVVPPVFTGFDGCAGSFSPVVTTNGPANTGCHYTQTWNANYTDPCNNPAVTKTITYTWTIDNTAPVISTTATTHYLGCNPGPVAAPVFTGQDGCAGSFTPAVNTTGPGNTGCDYTQTWTASYTDPCGNPATSVSITYTWTIDLIPPVISSTFSSHSLGCNPANIVAPVFTGLDGCAGPFTPVVSTDGPSGNGCAYSQTWTANYTDPCNNAATPLSITYTWTIDNTAPVITTTATTHYLGCNPGAIVAPVFTGLDGCAGPFTPVVSTNGPDHTGCNYTQTWTASYTDPCGNPALPVIITYTWTIDGTAPVISTTATTHHLGCNPGQIVPPVFTGNDGCTGVFSPVVTSIGPSATGCTYTQTWTANYTDPCNNPATPVSITYTWTIDLTPPVITTMATSHDLGCNPATIVAPEFTGNDGCAGTFSTVVTTNGPSNTGCLYTQTWTANYSDPCNNPAVPVSITYTWTVDQTGPVFSGCPQAPILLGCSPDLPTCAGALALVTATDACSGPVIPDCQAGYLISDGCYRSQSFTLTATDACQNTSTCTVVYQWTQDNTAPVISSNSSSGEFGCNSQISAPVFTGTDNCSGPFTPNVTTSGPLTQNGCDYSQTWTATGTDGCGNNASPLVVHYTWKVDTVPPVIVTTASELPAPCNPLVTAPEFTGSDNCGGTFNPEVRTTGSIGFCTCWYSQTWFATFIDACGNHAVPVNISYSWIIDTIPPVITTTATSGFKGTNPVITAPEFTGMDDCEGAFAPTVTTPGPVNTGGNNFTQTWTAGYADYCGNVAVPVSITYTWIQNGPSMPGSSNVVPGNSEPPVTDPLLSGKENRP